LPNHLPSLRGKHFSKVSTLLEMMSHLGSKWANETGMQNRQIKYFEAINEGISVAMERDENVYLMGLGVPDPTGVFGTTKGLREIYGEERVRDMPISENGMTGIALGSALVGKRPIMTHMRLEFAMTAVEQIVNQAAKWHYMFDGVKAPMVIRMIVGRGWGQGPQHSQSLHSWFAHVPGLKVIMPSTPRDAKGMLIAAVEDDSPVVSIEHRWLFNLHGAVPEGYFVEALDGPRVVRPGKDITIATSSYTTVEFLKLADQLAAEGVDAEIVDLRMINPFHPEVLFQSVRKTRHLLVADQGSRNAGFAGEVVARVSETCWSELDAAPGRVTLPDGPTPTSRALSNYYYPSTRDNIMAVRNVLGVDGPEIAEPAPEDFLDVPDQSFNGPF